MPTPEQTVTTPADPTIRDVLALMRCTALPSQLAPAYRIFEELLGELLLRGSSEPQADIARLLDELRMPGVSDWVRVGLCDAVFFGIVGTLAEYGPRRVDPDLFNRLWPPVTAAQVPLIDTMVKLIQLALVGMARGPGGEGLRRKLTATGTGWLIGSGRVVPKPRRGRPADPVRQSVYLHAITEELFPGKARPVIEVARAIAVAYRHDNATSAYQHALKLKKKLFTLGLPENWHETLLSRRIAPLHPDLFRPRAQGEPPPIVIAARREAARRKATGT